MSSPRRRRLALVAALGGAVAVTGCGPAEFRTGEPLPIEDALRREGLTVCRDATIEWESVRGAAPGRQLSLAADGCPGDLRRHTNVLTVVEFAGSDERDAALRRFEGNRRRVEGFGAQGAAWVYGPFVIALTGDHTDRVMSRVAVAMDRLGAT